MKKILLALLVLTSCSVDPATQKQYDEAKPLYEQTGIRRIVRFQYNEHDYIMFCGSKDGKPVHDPDCKKCFSYFD